MFCRKPLGTNEVIETFPVGRRLAFDAARGRLWVVCRKCERWNLSPLEERWEAVEDCDRIFRATRVRVSTENIGLARHPEGLTLVRIGEPLRPEFAAWRYGDQFGRRRRRKVLYGVGGGAVVGGFAAGAMAVGVVSGAALGTSLVNWWINARTIVRLRPEGGGVIRLKRPDLLNTRLLPSDDEAEFRIQIRKGPTAAAWYDGAEARRFAGAIMPHVNAMGGNRRTVRLAVERIETAGHPERFLAEVGRGDRFPASRGTPIRVNKVPRPTRLALEMALHEEQERRALEGELWLLERAWKEAEEIAAISDNLFPPGGAEDFIREHGVKQDAENPRRDPA